VTSGSTLIRRLDVVSSPDPEFVATTAALLRPRVRGARIQDMSRLGRIRRDVRLAVELPSMPPVPRPIAIAALLALLLAAIAALGIAGALLRAGPIGNGPLIIVLRGELRAIDVDTGSSRQVVPPAEHAAHVSRSRSTVGGSPIGRSIPMAKRSRSSVSMAAAPPSWHGASVAWAAASTRGRPICATWPPR
jgi:hypothetical protein